VARLRWICLDCRTALDAAACDAPEHRVVYAHGEEGREKWREEVWGPPELRWKAKRMARIGGGGIAGVVVSIELWQHGASSPVSWLLLGVILTLVLGGVDVVLRWIAALRAGRYRILPRGAAPTALAAVTFDALRGERLTGRIVDGKLMVSPGGEACFGYTLELHERSALASRTTLQHALTDGLSIALDDGSRLEVPAGRIRLDGPGEEVEPTRAQVQRRLGFDLEIPGRDGREHSPVPFDAAYEAVLREGMRVEVCGELTREAASEGAMSYRREPPLVRRPRGTLAMRIVAT
jgi:hypothetical protein